MEGKAFKYMEDAQTVTSIDFVTENLGDEGLTTFKYEEAYTMYWDSTEAGPDQVGFSPVFGLGFVLVVLTILSLCNAIWHLLLDTVEVRSEENIHRITPRNSPVTPTGTPSLRAFQETTPKRIGPVISRFPPGRIHLSTTPEPSFRRSSPESIETFEPMDYRFFHPDIPHELIGPGGSASYSNILRASTPEAGILRTSTPESDDLRSSTESDILPLHERTIQPPTLFTDGITRRKLSFSELVEWSSTDPDDVKLRRHSTPKHS